MNTRRVLNAVSFSFMAMLFGCVTVTHSPSAFDQRYHDFLVSLGTADQADRAHASDHYADTDDHFARALAANDLNRWEQLKARMARDGFPSISRVGHEGAEAAFEVLQHLPAAEIQESLLDRVKQAAETGDWEGKWYALLDDRVLVERGHPQRYGSQFSISETGEWTLAPLEDRARVDEFRAQMGMVPLKDYLAEARANGINVRDADQVVEKP